MVSTHGLTTSDMNSWYQPSYESCMFASSPLIYEKDLQQKNNIVIEDANDITSMFDSDDEEWILAFNNTLVIPEGETIFMYV